MEANTISFVSLLPDSRMVGLRGFCECLKTRHRTCLQDIEGRELQLSAFKGKVVLVVNVASKCGFTPQYKARSSKAPIASWRLAPL